MHEVFHLDAVLHVARYIKGKLITNMMTSAVAEIGFPINLGSAVVTKLITSLRASYN